MDGQDQKENTAAKDINLDHGISPNLDINALNQPEKPKLNLNDTQVRDLLIINNLQENQQKKVNPRKLFLLIIGTVVFILIVSFLSGEFNSSAAKKTPSSNPLNGLGVPNQPSPNTGSQANQQIKQDVKSCSNPVNATLAC